MLTACMCALRLSVQHPTLLAGSALGGLALHGSIVFWAFYLFNSAGKYVGLALVVLEIGVVAALAVHHGLATFRPIARLATPAAMTLVFTLFILSYGFIHGGTKMPSDAASSRFIAGLPVDNAIPLILAKAVESDVRPLPDPLYVNWSASDRPPLQTGIYLSVISVVGHKNSALLYSVVSSVLQSLWVIGIWAFFAAARIVRALAALITGAVLLSGFTLLNALYVWPKLLSAAYLLIVAAVFLTSNGRELLKQRGCATVLGLTTGGALLAHTGAGIALIALAFTVLIRREAPSWQLILPAVLVAAAVVAPWTAYQKIIDPPGDKLLKLQVAGIPNIETKRSLSDEIIDHYRRIGTGQTVRNKLNNVAEPFRGVDNVARDGWRIAEGNAGIDGITRSERDAAIVDLRVNQFFRLVPALGLIALGPMLFVLVLVAHKLGVLRRGPTLDNPGDEWSLVLFLALTILFWSLIMFGPNYTVIHQGTYLMPLIAFILCTSLWWAVGPAITAAVVVLQAAATLYLYKDIPLGARPDLFAAGTGLRPGGGTSMLALTVASLIATVALLGALLVKSPRQAVGT
jgi:hypothetical protein